MHTTLELDLKVKETLAISHKLGHRDGGWAAFSAVHEMLRDQGYRDLLPHLLELSREFGTPINERGEGYDEDDSAYTGVGGWGFYPHVLFRGTDYTQFDIGWREADRWEDGAISYKTHEEAQAAADAFLAEKQAQ